MAETSEAKSPAEKWGEVVFAGGTDWEKVWLALLLQKAEAAAINLPVDRAELQCCLKRLLQSRISSYLSWSLRLLPCRSARLQVVGRSSQTRRRR